jgi:hypothetical protein
MNDDSGRYSLTKRMIWYDLSVKGQFGSSYQLASLFILFICRNGFPLPVSMDTRRILTLKVITSYNISKFQQIKYMNSTYSELNDQRVVHQDLHISL